MERTCLGHRFAAICTNCATFFVNPYSYRSAYHSSGFAIYYSLHQPRPGASAVTMHLCMSGCLYRGSSNCAWLWCMTVSKLAPRANSSFDIMASVAVWHMYGGTCLTLCLKVIDVQLATLCHNVTALFRRLSVCLSAHSSTWHCVLPSLSPWIHKPMKLVMIYIKFWQ